MNLVLQARLLICAVQFLTRLPTPALPDFQPDWITRAARFFPLTGQLVGVLCAVIWLAASRVWPGLPAAALAIGAGVLITGGFHEDGLADTADGLGGGQDRERRLTIMKDSRIGSYGALALGLVMALKIALLARLGPWAGAVTLVIVHGGARAASVTVMAALPYAGDIDAAKVRSAPRGVSFPEAAFALVTGFWPLIFLGLPKAALAASLVVIAAGSMALVARELIGGVTGDVLGAVEQLCEAALLLAAAASFAV